MSKKKQRRKFTISKKAEQLIMDAIYNEESDMELRAYIAELEERVRSLPPKDGFYWAKEKNKTGLWIVEVRGNMCHILESGDDYSLVGRWEDFQEIVPPTE